MLKTGEIPKSKSPSHVPVNGKLTKNNKAIQSLEKDTIDYVPEFMKKPELQIQPKDISAKQIDVERKSNAA